MYFLVAAAASLYIIPFLRSPNLQNVSTSVTRHAYGNKRHTKGFTAAVGVYLCIHPFSPVLVYIPFFLFPMIFSHSVYTYILATSLWQHPWLGVNNKKITPISFSIQLAHLLLKLHSKPMVRSLSPFHIMYWLEANLSSFSFIATRNLTHTHTSKTAAHFQPFFVLIIPASALLSLPMICERQIKSTTARVSHSTPPGAWCNQ